MIVRNLKKQFIGKGEVKGFSFTLIKQSFKVYIYRVNTGCLIYYEVFRKKAKTNSEYHCFPTSKAFGVWAWTYPTFDKALNMFNQLNKAKND